MSEMGTESGETTPTGVITPSTVADRVTTICACAINSHKELNAIEELRERISKLETTLLTLSQRPVSPFPNVFKQHPAIGSVSFSPTSGTSLLVHTKSDIPYVTSQETSTSKPAIVAAIRGFSKQNHEANPFLYVTPTNQRDDVFDMQYAIRPREAAVTNIEVDWLEIPEEHTRCGLWQHGEFTVDFESKKVNSLKPKIQFPKPFSNPPKVVVWLAGFEAGSGNPLRISCFIESPEKVTNTEAELFVGTYCDSVMYNMKVSWVAYDSTLKGVHSGSVDTCSFRTWQDAQHFNTSYAEFPPGTFSKAPKVILGIKRLAFEKGKEQNIKAFASNVSPFGFCWNANSWGNTVNYGMGLTYLAIEGLRD